jgi:flagellar biosynthesis protein FliR
VNQAIQLPEIAASQLVAFVLVAARVGPLFALAPGFSSRLIPPRIKAVAAGAIALTLTPVATQGRVIPTDAVEVANLLVKEVAVGLAFALAVGIVSAAVQAGASLLDTVVGFSFGALVDPITNVQTSVLAQLYSLVAAMVFLLTGGDRVMLLGLAKSYSLLPVGTMPSLGSLAALATSGLTQVALISVEIAAPVAVALLVTDAALGLVARAVPQLNVLFVGIPAKIMIAFTVVAASLPLVATRLDTQLQDAVLRALEALSVR